MGIRTGESDSTSCVCLQGVVSVWLSDKARDIGLDSRLKERSREKKADKPAGRKAEPKDDE